VDAPTDVAAVETDVLGEFRLAVSVNDCSSVAAIAADG